MRGEGGGGRCVGRGEAGSRARARGCAAGQVRQSSPSHSETCWGPPAGPLGGALGAEVRTQPQKGGAGRSGSRGVQRHHRRAHAGGRRAGPAGKGKPRLDFQTKHSVRHNCPPGHLLRQGRSCRGRRGGGGSRLLTVAAAAAAAAVAWGCCGPWIALPDHAPARSRAQRRAPCTQQAATAKASSTNARFMLQVCY